MNNNRDGCPGCGDEVKDNLCDGCGYCHEPLKAYLANQIEYGHISMYKMSTEDWKIANAIKEERNRVARGAR